MANEFIIRKGFISKADSTIQGNVTANAFTTSGGTTIDSVTGSTFNTSTGNLTLTTLSGVTIVENLDGKYVEISGYTDSNNYISGATFNTTDGVLTLTYLTGGTTTVDLDDRYSLTGHTHPTYALESALVTHSGATNPHNTPLSGLTDTNISSPSDGQVLTWDVPTARWINDDIAGGNGNDYVTSGSFNTTSGVITLSRLSGGTVNYGLDGKYLDLSGGTLTGNVNGPAFVTDGGTINHFVKGDGSLQADTLYSLTGHTHPTYALESALVSHSGNTSNPHSVTKAQVGLSNVVDIAQASQVDFVTHSGDSSIHYTQASISIPASQISDFDASVSANTEVALNTAKISYSDAGLNSHTGDTANPHSVTQTQVGLSNVVNVEQATLAEFDIHTGDTSNPHSVTQTQVGLSNVDNTTDANKPVSTATQTALDLKASQVDLVTTSGSVTTLETNFDSHTGDTANPHSTALSGLTDANISSPNDGEILAWDNASNKWVPSGSTGGGATTLTGLTDTELSAATDGKVLTYQASTQEWIASASTGGGSSTISGSTDTNVGVPTDGEVLTWDTETARWIASGSTGGVAEWQTLEYTGSTGALAITSGNTIDLGFEFVDTGSGFTFGSHTNTLIVGGDIELESAVTPGFEYYFPEQTGTVALTSDLGHITGATFNTTDGIITLTDLTGGTITVDIDDRYAVTSGTSSQFIKGDGTLESDTLYSTTGHTHPLYALESALVSHSGNTSNPHSVTKAQVGLTNVVDVEQATLAEYDIHTGDTSNPHSVTQTQVGLSNVDNTSDADKPVSTATQTALDLKANEAALVSHSGNTSNPHSVTKAQVGLTNVVDVEQATLAEYDIHTGDTSNPHSVTQTQVGLGSVDDTSDADKPVSTATQTALDLKANESALVSHSGNTSNPHSVTKAQIGLTNVVDIAQASQADFVTHSGATNPHLTPFSGLSDVNISSPIDGDVATWDTETARWVASGTTGGSSTISGSTDANVGVPTDGEVLTWDTETARWIASASTAGGATTLSGLTDTELSATTHDYVLTYNSGTTKWEASEATGGIAEWQTLAYTGSTGALAITSGNTIDLGWEFVDTSSGFTFGSHTNTLIVGGDIEIEAALTPGFEYYFPEQTGTIALTSDLGHVTGATFNTGDGVITLTDLTGGTITVDIDDRYSLTGHTHTLTGLTDTELSATTDGYILTYDGITDKWIASASTANSLTFDNGLTRTTNNVQLGGDLTKNTTVGLGTGDYYLDFLMQPSGNVYSQSRFHKQGFWSEGYDNDTFTRSAIYGEARPTFGYIWLNATDTTGSDSMTIELKTTVGMTVTDTVNNKGLVYAADYSVAFTNRSLIDRGFADTTYSLTGHTHALSGLTDSNVGTPTDGEVLTWDTETARWIASGATGGSSTISGSTDANVGTPADGEALRWDTETAKWIASGVTEGNVYKVGAPSNNQIGVWTGNGTLEGDSALLYDNSVVPSLYIGLNDTTTGNLYIFGGSGGGGGAFHIYNGATGDTDDNHYTQIATNGTLYFSGNLTGDFLTYQSSSQVIATLKAITSNQTNAQIITTGLDSLITKDFGDSAYVGSGATYSLSGLTDTTFAITPTDGDSLTWNDSASSWSATTGGGGGNVSNTGTPLNNQIGVWTNATTVEGDVGLTYTANQLNIGVDDTATGIVVLWGGPTTQGGQFYIYNGANGDTDDNYYLTQAISGVYSIKGNATGDFLTYYSSNQQLAFSGAVISDQTTSQILTTGNSALITKEYGDQYYASSGVTYSLSGLTDTTFAITPADGQNLTWNDSASSWSATTAAGGGDVTKVNTPSNNQIGVWTGNGTIEGTTDFQYNSTNRVLLIGVDDTSDGSITLYGDSGTIGARLSMYNGATDDTDDDFYQLQSDGGLFKLTGNLTGNFLTYTSSSQVIGTLGGITSDQTNAQIIATGLDSLITKDFGDSAYVGSGATYSLSGLTDTTFAITPTDGQNLTWNDSASSWSATTGGGGGDVTKVNTPLNDQIGVWTGDGTLEGDAGLTFATSGNLLSVGEDGVSGGRGLLYLYGSDTTHGGGIRLYPGANVDTENDYFILQADNNGDFSMQGSLTGQFFDYDSGTDVIAMPLGLLNLGANGTTQGILSLYGNATSLGGKMNFYHGNDQDTDDDFYQISASATGIFQIQGDITGAFLTYTSSSQVIGTLGGITSDQTTPQILTTGNSALITKEYGDQYYASSGATSLSGLSDTTFAITPTDGQALVWNDTASSWSANTISGETGPTGLTGADGEVTSGGTFTLSNKRIQPRVVSATTYTTDTGTSLDIETCDIFVVTALDGALLFNNPSGTPSDGEKIMIRIKDDGTARALTYGSEFRAMGNALPTTTVISKTLYMGISYNGLDGNWDLIASAQEA